MSENKNRKFLKPLAVVVAAVLATAGSDAMATPALQTALDKANQVVIEQNIEQSQPAPLVIESSEQMDTNLLAGHYSHRSHSSHSSHRSHYSGY